MDIETRIKRGVADYFGVNEVNLTNDTDFIKDLQADSVDQIELMLDFEDEFGIEVNDEDIEDLHTIGDIAEYVKQKKE